MDSVVTRQLRVKGTAPDALTTHEHRVFAVAVVVECQHVEVLGPGLDLRRADEDAGNLANTLHLHQRLETRDLSAVAVAANRQRQHVETPLVTSSIQDLVGQEDQPRARAEDPQSVGDLLLQRRTDTRRREEIGDRGRFPAGHHQAVEVLQLFGAANGDDVGPDTFEHRSVFAHVALQGENANARHVYQPRSARRCSKEAVSIPFIAAPSPVETFATTWASRKCVAASTIALAPSCNTSAASAGVEMPPAQKSGTGSLPVSDTSCTSGSGACSSLANENSSFASADWSRRIWALIVRRCRTASTTLPVPASPFERIKHAPSPIRRRASPKFVAPHTKGTVKPHLSMWFSSSAGVSTSDSSM